MNSVEIYSTPTCGSCMRAKRLLQGKGADITEHDVSMDRSEMIERSNGRTTVPQIFIGGSGIGGWDDLLALDRSGELDQLLAGE